MVLTTSDSAQVALIYPDWPAPVGVKAVCSTRDGGVSAAAYSSLNLGDHVGDDAQAVQQNRKLYQLNAAMPSVPVWLNQVHSTTVLRVQGAVLPAPIADASVTASRNVVCTVMTADCLPLLVCDRDGQQVAAIHAGWRGLCNGIIEQTLAHFQDKSRVMVWLGPAIGPNAFEVGAEVRSAFIRQQATAAQAFHATANDKYLADLYLLARQRLHLLGVNAIYGGNYCTYQQAAQFFSYRRDGQTGRMASSIWLEQ